MSKNRFGLSRNIPEEVKRKVRQNSKFGCVIPNCRNAFYEYEHIIPEFKDATEHDPEKICLVCCNHNPRRTGEFGQENYSKEQIERYYELVKSSNKVPSTVNKDFFNGFKIDPTIIMGNSSFKKIDSIINIDGVNGLSFHKNDPADPFAPQITFSGIFKDSTGNILFEIKENEWSSPTYHWDVITTNGEISIWDNSKELVFNARKYPIDNLIEITHLNMWFNPFHILVQEGVFAIGRYSNDMNSWVYFTIDSSFEAGYCGIYLNSKELFDFPVWAGISMNGGEGVHVIGNGIWIGKGTARVLIRNISFSKSDVVPTIQIETAKKVIDPPSNAHYFVTGKLHIEKVQFPNWTEDVYFLNGQRLRSLPNSWGVINDIGENLYYIDRNEPEDLSQNIGFVGFYADDVLQKEWADKVFEAVVEVYDIDGNMFTQRVKRSEILGRRIISELNPQTNKFYHPHEFFGSSPWK